MIELPATRAPPSVGVNANVTLALDLPNERSAVEIENSVRWAAPPMPPDATAFDGSASAAVVNTEK